jgi:hypothetical protein
MIVGEINGREWSGEVEEWSSQEMMLAVPSGGVERMALRATVKDWRLEEISEGEYLLLTVSMSLWHAEVMRS